MNDKELFPDNDLHDALADAYRQLATAAPPASTLTLPQRRRADPGPGRLALVAAAAVAVIAIPTVVITLTQHDNGSNQKAAAPLAPTQVAGSSTPSPAAAPAAPTADATSTVTVAAQPAPSGSPTPGVAEPSFGPAPAAPIRSGSAPASVEPTRTLYPTPMMSGQSAPGDGSITGPGAVAKVPRTPFAVGYLPAGYSFESAQTSGSPTKAPSSSVDFGFVGEDGDTIYISSADFDNVLWLQDGQTKPTTVNGRQARMMDGLLATKVGSSLVLVQSKGVLPAGELRRIAEGLTFAPDPDNTASWFRTTTAIPGANLAPTSTVTASVAPPSASPAATPAPRTTG
ncbi:MAG: hypothetical protein ACR2P2_02875 [Nakamurella sp.]